MTKPRAAEPKRSRRWRRTGWIALVAIAALVGARLALPHFVRDYVNRTLAQNQHYEGRIGDVSLHLWRGAYSIEDIRLVKTTGTIPVPFFAAKRVDLALDTPALLAGKLVGHVLMEEPEMNFVDSESEAESQTGAGGPWLTILSDLYPFEINSTEIRDGKLHFRAFQREPQVDVYLSQLEGTIDNLTNTHDDVTPMISTVQASGLAMDHARLEYEMKLDPFSYRPTFQLALRLIGLDLTQTNSLARAYGNFDFEQGWFDLVIELDVKEGTVTGYVKPLFRDLRVFDLDKDTRSDAILALWEAVVGMASELFRNQARNQVATLIPIRGQLEDPQADIAATIGNILRNAFVRAYLPKLQGIASEIHDLRFEPGSIGEPSTK